MSENDRLVVRVLFVTVGYDAAFQPILTRIVAILQHLAKNAKYEIVTVLVSESSIMMPYLFISSTNSSSLRSKGSPENNSNLNRSVYTFQLAPGEFYTGPERAPSA